MPPQKGIVSPIGEGISMRQLAAFNKMPYKTSMALKLLILAQGRCVLKKISEKRSPSMKNFKTIVILCMLLLPLPAIAADLGTAEISLIQGDVSIYTEEAGDWLPATLNMPVKEGDRLWVGENGRAELHVMGGVYVRFEANTSFDILSLDRNGLHFYMDRGHVYLNNKQGGIQIAQVDTPIASCNSYDNSIMVLDVESAGATGVGVLKGSVYVENRNGKTRVNANSYLRVDNNGYAELSPLGAPDQWEKWNLRRDRDMAGMGESSRYLPEELQEFSSHFDESGHWSYIRDYGYVWTPSSVTDDWAPYRFGRWVWIRNDYVWISTERWGWAPYHYGRWAFVNGLGWCWVPPRPGYVYWAPGYVAWTYTSTHVSWVPLAPRDVYYGRGYYGPNSVNITVVNINKTVISQKMNNITVNNAVTVVPLETFTKGVQHREKIKENLFIEHGVKTGPPPVKQEIKAVFPGVKTGRPAIRSAEKVSRESSPEIKRVPEEKRETEANKGLKDKVAPEKQKVQEEKREQRRLVRDAESSVFSHGRPAPLPVKQLDEPKVIIRKHENRQPEGVRTGSGKKEEREKVEKQETHGKGQDKKEHGEDRQKKHE